MKINVARSCLIIGTLLIPIAGYAAGYADNTDSDRTHPTTFVNDSVITTKIKAMLADDKMRSLAHVMVDTDSNGVVVLSGNVRTQEEANKAVSIARSTDGVTSVKNRLQIKRDDD
ncbi:MAG: BON domain-containing protein [Sulfuricaulis sp.]